MKKSKLDYSAPEAEVFVVRVERGIMSLQDSVNAKNHTQYLKGGIDDDYEDL